VIVADVVDGGALLQVVWVGLVVGLLLITAVSLAIFGAARAGAERRRNRSGPATLFVLLSGASGAICLAAVGIGVAVIVDKG
jgi:hypothetical protein